MIVETLPPTADELERQGDLMAVEAPIPQPIPQHLRLTSMDFDTAEGASILGSFRGGSRDCFMGITTPQFGNTPRDATAGWAREMTPSTAEDLMSAPSFFLASITSAKSMDVLLGSRELQALHSFIADSEAGDNPTDLPFFRRRAPSKSIRAPSRSHDWAAGLRLCVPPLQSAGSAELILPPMSSSREQRTPRSFFDIIDNAAAATGGTPREDAALPQEHDASPPLPCPPADASTCQQSLSSSRPAVSHYGLGEEEAVAPARRRPQRASAAVAASLVAAQAAVESAAGAASPTGSEAERSSGKSAKAVSAKARRNKRKAADDDEGSGTHVRHRPDMQKKARDGQEHWLTQVKRVRAEWTRRDEASKDSAYPAQVDACAAQQIKSQHECLLRTLQMAKTDGLIQALPFAECGPDSFLGWTGFSVVPECAQDFRKRIDALFPIPLKENTLHTSFRRAGLVPDKWSSGWLGLTPFCYSNDKRVAYAPTLAAAAAATKKAKH